MEENKYLFQTILLGLLIVICFAQWIENQHLRAQIATYPQTVEVTIDSIEIVN